MSTTPRLGTATPGVPTIPPDGPGTAAVVGSDGAVAAPDVPTAGPGIVVDVGGTRTRLALAERGRLVGEVVRFDTPHRRDHPGFPLDQIRADLLDRLAAEADRLHRAAGSRDRRDLGVAFGAVVTVDGEVRDASVLWQAQSAGFDVRAALARRLPWARVTVLNDVAAAAWHYRRLGRFALVTVSTGVAVKVFDDSLPGTAKVLADPAGLGGEIGHVPVEAGRLDTVPGGPVGAAWLGRAATAGDRAAQEELARLDLPWCDCGAVADLCAYASGPAVVRAAIRRAQRPNRGFAGSALHRLVGGEPARITTRTLAEAARHNDPFTLDVLRTATRPLAVVLLQVCAQLGLRTVVVVGGFAHGVGGPWFAALRGWLAELAVDAGWFQGWTTADRTGLLHVPDDPELATLAGMAGYLAEQRGRTREVVKPVGEARLLLGAGRWPRCGREQLLLRPRYAGLCGTDLQILRGDRGLEPGVLGHECVAEVVEVGSDVPDGPRPGDLVTLNPNHPTDDYLKLGHNIPGVFRDVVVVDRGTLGQGQLVGLPGDCGPEWVLVEPLAAVLRAQQAMSGEWAGQDVLVVGGGVLALLHVALARVRGARTVTVAARTDRRLRAALGRGLPAPDAVLPLDPGLAAGVRAATAGRGAGLAVVAVAGDAGPAATEQIWPALADRAVLHLFGGFPAGRPLPVGGAAVDPGPLRSAAGRQRVDNPAGGSCTLVGSRGGRRADFAAALDLLTGGAGRPPSDLLTGVAVRSPSDLPVGVAGRPSIDLTPLVSHLVSLPALPAVAAELLAAGTVAGHPPLRVVVDLRLDGTVIHPTGDSRGPW
ncbi:ROK family protein [Plantactinospora sonchi]|uniref:ROK family protein n=1 Tax=Plantactinospora sonchi TaxID=1544735 RepID=A0ABU7RUP0_9ACTN